MATDKIAMEGTKFIQISGLAKKVLMTVHFSYYHVPYTVHDVSFFWANRLNINLLYVIVALLFLQVPK